MNDESGARAWAPRVLAPLAFFTAATVLVLIIHSSLTSESEGSTTPPAATATGTGTGPDETATLPTTTGQGASQRRFYRIQEGDTLEAIALRFDTTVDDLLQLNPAVEPNALTPGQRIRVR